MLPCERQAPVAELVDAADLKSAAPKGACRFESGPGHQPSSLARSSGVMLSGMKSISTVLLLFAALSAFAAKAPKKPAEFKGPATMCNTGYALCIKARC